MKISIINGTRRDETSPVDEVASFDSLDELGVRITQTLWAPSVFNRTDDGMLRSNKNLKYTQLMVLDIDDGMTIKQAIKVIKDNGFRAIIGITRSHQKDKKSGENVYPPCDRFRIIIPLEERIWTDKDFKATWYEAQKLFPAIDPSCKDSARFYYPCQKIIRRFRGKKFPVILAKDVVIESSINHCLEESVSDSSQRGKLAKFVYNFIEHGAPKGQWHHLLYKVAIEFRQNLYSQIEAIQMLQSKRITLDKHHDLKLIDDVYRNRKIKYPPRLSEVTAPASFNQYKPIYVGKTIEERQADLNSDRLMRKKALKSKTDFISSDFRGVIDLFMGLCLVGGASGDGKSTVAANIIAGFITQKPEKQALIISNEDVGMAVLTRVACIILKKSFSKYWKSELEENESQVIEDKARKLTKQIEVISPNDKTLDMTKYEDVKAVLEMAKKNPNIGLILIDYFQLIDHTHDGGTDSWKVLKTLGAYFRKYGTTVPIPVVLFGQLRPNSDSEPFSQRFQNDRTIFNHSLMAIEVIADFETKITRFIVHKDRWGDAKGKEVPMEFDSGRLVTPRGYAVFIDPIKKQALAEKDDF